MIRLRTTSAQLENVAGLLVDTMKHAAEETGLVRIHMYNSVLYRTDVALSLTWDTSSFQHEGSRAGLSISEALKTFGLVEHSIWVEKETS